MALEIAREDNMMEETDPEVFGESWAEDSLVLDEPAPAEKLPAKRKHSHWRSVEEYQEWKKLRKELEELDYDF
jgi:hypothetical protein